MWTNINKPWVTNTWQIIAETVAATIIEHSDRKYSTLDIYSVFSEREMLIQEIEKDKKRPQDELGNVYLNLVEIIQTQSALKIVLV